MVDIYLLFVFRIIKGRVYGYKNEAEGRGGILGYHSRYHKTSNLIIVV